MSDPLDPPAAVPRGARVVVATGNPGKLREMQAILDGSSIELVSLAEAGAVDFPPEGGDYGENARVKAEVAAAQLGAWALADDSGLEVDGLDGGPGPYSARYGGPGLDDAGRVAHLLAELGARDAASRAARFVCWAALASPEGEVWLAYGECRGRILDAPRGTDGFGYDPVFEPEGDTRSMAELDDAEKNEISHRARARSARWFPSARRATRDCRRQSRVLAVPYEASPEGSLS